MKITPKEYYQLQKSSSPKDYEKILKKLSNTTNSRKFFGTSDGRMCSERKNLHNEIINDYLKICKPQQHSVLEIITGSIGSGKTSVKDTIIKKKNKKSFIYINFDDLKKRLPEYEILKNINPKKAAEFVQSESAKLAGTLFKKAMQKKINIIYEKNTTTNQEGKFHMVEEINKALEKKYRIQINVIFLNTHKEAWKRVQKRNKEIGRYVPKDKVITTFKDLFPNLKKLVDTKIKGAYSIFFWLNDHNDSQSVLNNSGEPISIGTFLKGGFSEKEEEEILEDKKEIVILRKEDSVSFFEINKLTFLSNETKVRFEKAGFLE